MLAGANIALLAVGGYGRRQLFPYSDIDLLLLFESDQEAEGSKKIIAPFLQCLWDSGLRVSHSVSSRDLPRRAEVRRQFAGPQ